MAILSAARRRSCRTLATRGRRKTFKINSTSIVENKSIDFLKRRTNGAVKGRCGRGRKINQRPFVGRPQRSAKMPKKYLVVVVATVLLVAIDGAAALMSSPPSKPQPVACKPGFIHLTESFCVLAPCKRLRRR